MDCFLRVLPQQLTLRVPMFKSLEVVFRLVESGNFWVSTSDSETVQRRIRVWSTQIIFLMRKAPNHQLAIMMQSTEETGQTLREMPMAGMVAEGQREIQYKHKTLNRLGKCQNRLQFRNFCSGRLSKQLQMGRRLCVHLVLTLQFEQLL